MAEQIQLELSADVSRLRADLGKLQSDFESLNSSAKDLRESQRLAFASDSTKDHITAIEKASTTYRNQKQVVKELEQYEKLLLEARRRANDPAAVTRLNAELLRTRTALEEVRARSREALVDFNEAGNTSIGIFGKLKGVLGGLVAVGTLTGLAQQAITAANEVEQLRVSYETLAGSVLKGNILLNQLIDKAASTPFEIKDIAKSSNQLLAFGFAAEEIIPVFDILGNIASGVGTDKLPQLVLALGQVRGATRLTGNELRQFTEAGVPLLTELANVTGKSVKVLQKEVSEGAISFEQVLAALRGLTTEGGRFFNLMEKQSQTTAGQLSNLRDNLFQLLAGIGASFKPITDGVLAGISGLVSVFKDLFPATQSATQALTGMQVQLNNEIDTLKRAKEGVDGFKISKEAESSLRNSINAKMTEIGIPNLLTEKSTIEQITVAQNAANTAFDKKITLIAGQEKLVKIRQAELDLVLQEVEATKLQTRLQQEAQTVEFKGKDAAFLKQSFNDAVEVSNLGVVKIAEKRKALQDESKKFLDAMQKLGLSEKDLAGGGTPSKSGGTPSSGLTEKQKKDIEKTEKERAQLTAQYRKLSIDLTVNDIEREKALAALKQEDLLKQIKEFETKKIITSEQARSLRLNAEIQFQEDIAAIDKKASEKRVKELIDRIKEENAQREALQKEFESGVTGNAERNRKFQQEQIELEKAQFESGQLAAQEIFSHLERTEKQKDDFKKRLAQEREIFEKTTAQRLLKIELEYLEATKLVNDNVSQAQIDTLKKRIENFDKEIASIQNTLPTSKPDKEKKTSLWSLLGMDENTDKGKKEIEIAKAATKEIVGLINSIADEQVKAADKAVESADRRVQAAENELNREIELSKLGYASNVEEKQKALDLEKANQATALEEQRKAAKAKADIDTATQASSLLTAVAGIIAGYSALPIIGQVLSIIAIGAMFAAFAKARSTAYQAIKAEKGIDAYIDNDGIIRGNSHSDGGVGIEAEGGEAVQSSRVNGKQRVTIVNKKMTAKHHDLLKAINADDTRAMRERLSELVGVPSASPQYQVNYEATKDIDKAEIQQKEQAQINEKRKIDALEKNNRYWERYFKENTKDDTTDLGDKIQIRRGNSTTIVRK
jgi:tape measure domain-containing protein